MENAYGSLSLAAAHVVETTVAAPPIHYLIGKCKSIHCCSETYPCLHAFPSCPASNIETRSVIEGGKAYCTRLQGNSSRIESDALSDQGKRLRILVSSSFVVAEERLLNQFQWKASLTLHLQEFGWFIRSLGDREEHVLIG